MAIPCGFKVQNLSALYYIICVGINIIYYYNSFILSVKASHLVRRSQKTKKTQKKKQKKKRNKRLVLWIGCHARILSEGLGITVFTLVSCRNETMTMRLQEMCEMPIMPF